jgi:hypothetical protein
MASRASLADSAAAALIAKHTGAQASVLRSLASKAAGMAFRDAGILVVMSVAAGACVLVAAARRFPAALPALLLLGVTSWDIGLVDARFVHPTRLLPLSSYYPETAAVRFLKAQPGPFRVLPLGEDFGSNAFMYHGLESVGGYHPAKLAAYDAIMDRVGFTNLKLLALLNVKYVIGPEDLGHPAFVRVADGVHEFLGALPRAFPVGRVERVDSEEAALSAFGRAGFDPSTTAVLTDPLPGPVGSVEGASAEIVSSAPGRIEVRASAPQPCLLVFSEVYYEPGWKAFVDGKEARIHRTDYAFRSVYLESGTHSVVMSYAAGTVRRGLLVSVGAALAIAALWAVPSRGRRHAS